jgi:hypothetical protein
LTRRADRRVFPAASCAKILTPRPPAALREAVAESRLAYELSANSYRFAAMNACNAAERALEVLCDALAAEAEA